MAEDPQSWAAQRRRAAEHHAEVARRQAASDTAKAQAMVEAFVAAAIQTLPTEPAPRPCLRRWHPSATGPTGTAGTSAATTPSASAADATYLVLTVPGSLLGSLRGVSVPAADPPLVVGRGGPDGVAIDLRDLLAQRLAAGPDF